MVLLPSCGIIPEVLSLIPEKVEMDDPKIEPLLDATREVDTVSLGFTPLPDKADVRLEGPSRHGGYDAMLHIEADTSRTIAFRKNGSQYKWIGEQEIHKGPNQYTGPDGTFYEEICITYETVHISGVPLGRTCISYFGEDPRFKYKNPFSANPLTLAEVQPILEEWRKARMEPVASQPGKSDE